MRTRFLIVMALVCAACGPDQDDLSSADWQITGESEIIWTRLHTPCPGKLRYMLEREGVYVAGSHHRKGNVDIYTSAAERDFLLKKFAERIDWVEEKQLPTSRALSDYHEPSEVYDFLDQIQNDFPDIALKVMLEDELWEGQIIYAMKISDNVTVDEDEPTYVQDGQMHSNEVMGGEVCIDMIEHLTSNYGTDPEVTRWVDEMEIWVIPQINPDGAYRVHNGYSSQRKNRYPNCNVDLNRNFPWSWRKCSGSSSSCSSSNHHGQSAGSEPETQALMALWDEVRPLYYMNYHSSGEYIIWPGGCGRVDEHDLYLEIGRELNDRVETDDGDTGEWTIGCGYDVMYSAPGIARGTAYGKYGVMGFNIELNNSQQPTYSTWRDITCQRQRAAWGHLLNRSIDGPRVWGHTYDINTLDPVVANYQFANHPFTSGQEPLRTDPQGRFDRVVKLYSDHLMVFTASGYLPEARAAHVETGPVELDVPMTPGQNQNAPIGHAGDDFTVNEGDLVILDGTQSYDPDGNDVFFLWTKTSGPDILLKDVYSAQPSFYAPSVDADTSVIFRMVAWDGELESDPDTVTVTILDVWDEGWDGTADDIPLDIPDNDPSGISSIIHVDVDRYVLGVSALVDITHPYVGDLRLLLSSPSGTTVVLRHREGGSADNIHESYQPLEFIGEMSGGDWMLTVIDLGPTDLGRLNYWTLSLDLVGDAICADAADCDLPHVAVHDCAGGICQIVTCDTGWDNCNGHLHDGCEYNVSADSENCGACGNVCSLPNATSDCLDGQCVVDDCLQHFLNCNSTDADGCEAHLPTDPLNCGGCGNECLLPSAVTECQAGSCVLTGCQAGFANCDSNDTNGCEVDLLTDPLNCGECDSVCGLPNASAGCAGGECTVAACDDGYGDCNLVVSDGCETTLTDNMDHCGGCNEACDLPGAISDCVGGVCNLVNCNTGLGDCNDDSRDGCESDLATSLDHCGGCDQACSLAGATSACVAGECTLQSCIAGHENCNQDDNDGCEVDTRADPDNCGGCDNACELAHAQADCRDGSCAIGSCDNGYADCNQQTDDGCEANTQTDADHCGSCDNSCNENQACLQGSCEDTCSDVDGDGHLNAACGGDDCNDSDANINPTATEDCNNGVDDDCDGRIDRGSECPAIDTGGGGCNCGTPAGPASSLGLLLIGLAAVSLRRRRG